MHMETIERLSTKTADDLTHSRSLDFARLIGLQAKFAGMPDPGVYALRNFAAEFPRAIHADLLAKPRWG